MTVIYTLTEEDASAIRMRRTDAHAGESYPAVLVRKFGRGAGRSGNLLVHLDKAIGDVCQSDPLSADPSDVKWTPSVPRGSGRTPGTWEPLRSRDRRTIICAAVVALLLYAAAVCLWTSSRVL